MGTLLAFRGDGLGARLCTVINAIRLSNQCGLPFKISWFVIPGRDVSPEQIFSERYIAENMLTGYHPEEILIRDTSLISSRSSQEFVEFAKPGVFYCINTAFSYLDFTDQDPSARRAEVDKAISQIEWNEEVTKVLDQFASLDLRKYRAVHIRRGDLLEEPYSHVMFYEKYAPASLFVEHLRRDTEQTGRQEYIIFSDNPETAQHVKSQLHGGVTPGELLALDHLTPWQRDFVELMMMARTGLIIAPPESAFSRTASMIGGIAPVEVGSLLPFRDRIAFLSQSVLFHLDQPHRRSELLKDILVLAEWLSLHGEHGKSLAVMRKVIGEFSNNISFLKKFIEMLIANSHGLEALQYAYKLRDLSIKKHIEFWILNDFALREEADFITASAIFSALSEIGAGDQHEPAEALRQAGLALIGKALSVHPSAPHYMKAEADLRSWNSAH